MLRIGLTGELGSGKSTVARLLAEHGAVVLSSDEMARAMMQPGHPVYQAIADHFGPSVLLPDGQLNRPELARLAFDASHPRVEELNAIIHPAVIAEQEHRLADIARTQPGAIVVIESALIFTTRHAGGEEPWRKRFDRIVVVNAPDSLKLARFLSRAHGNKVLSDVQRNALLHDAEGRLAAQRLPAQLPPDCIQIDNTGDLQALESSVETLWHQLLAMRGE